MTKQRTEQDVLDELKSNHDIESMVGFDNLNIQEKLQNNTFLMIKYKELYIREKAIYETLEDKYEKLKGMRYHHYRFESDLELKKAEIEAYYLPKDLKILQMKRILRMQKIRVDFFDTCAKAFEKRQWCMNTFSNNMRGGAI
jgi:hypothetical protein